MARWGEEYRCMRIVDAIASINQKVNIIGVVLETGIPKQSKGTDCFLTMKIVDESCSNPGMSLTMFAAKMEQLPLVESSGDIINLCRIVMKFHNGQVHGVFHKKFSSFALFKGKHGASFIPYQVWPSFKPRDQDKKFIVALRQLSVDYELAGGSNKSLSLKEIRVGRDLSLLCKVLQICEVENKPLLLIWDGTDTSPATIQSKLEDEMENPLPLQVEPFPLPRDILLSLPDAGTVLRLIVDEDHEVLGLHLLKTGRWVKFVDLNCELHAGLWCVKLMPYTRLRFVPNEDPLILESERYYEKRLSSKFGRMPLSSTPLSHTTVTNLEDVPFVTLTNILAHPQATAKFRCVVRVIAAIPWRIEDFRSPHGTYRIRLTLEDSTARLHAFVYSKDGVSLIILDLN